MDRTDLKGKGKTVF